MEQNLNYAKVLDLLSEMQHMTLTSKEEELLVKAYSLLVEAQIAYLKNYILDDENRQNDCSQCDTTCEECKPCNSSGSFDQCDSCDCKIKPIDTATLEKILNPSESEINQFLDFVDIFKKNLREGL